MNTIADNIQKELKSLIFDNYQLLETCKFVLRGLEEMTTEEFSVGKDKIFRNRLEHSIELHKVYSQPIKESE